MADIYIYNYLFFDIDIYVMHLTERRSVLLLAPGRGWVALKNVASAAGFENKPYIEHA